ncbi:MAG: DUF523 domain-containing protein [Bacillales bacterium]|jgi:uncharacterized protein YbbK (DUF523 family)|nr:DUF523 domain-containing protein [Bacillales bacterium]
MSEEIKKVIVSACLLGKNCRYNGKNSLCPEVVEYLKDKEYLDLCPEELGMLPTPRPPAELLGNKCLTQDGSDFTFYFETGAYTAIKKAIAFKATEAILKTRSPSCGKGEIYDGTFTHTVKIGHGFFCEKCLTHKIKVLTELDIIALSQAPNEEEVSEKVVVEKVKKVSEIVLTEIIEDYILETNEEQKRPIFKGDALKQTINKEKELEIKSGNKERIEENENIY